MALKVLINIPRSYMATLKSPRGSGVIRLGLFRILWGRTFVGQLTNHDTKTENLVLMQNFEMGVDIAKLKKHYSTFRKKKTADNAKLKEFLLEKGADMKTIASILSRFPKAQGACSNELSEVWNMWESILKEDYSVLKIVSRSPESFFRSRGVKKLAGNISFLQSLGLSPKLLSQLMAKAPRTFSNTVELNKEKVTFLRELVISLGEEDPEKCIVEIITSNIFILTKSIKRMKANIESIQSLIKFENKILLSWIKDKGAGVLGLCDPYVENNLLNIRKFMQSVGCTEADVSQFIYKSPDVLLLSPKLFASKVNLLLECGIEASEILDTPHVLLISLASLKHKITLLQKCGYEFKSQSLKVLQLSQMKFSSKLQKLSSSADKTAKMC